MNISSGGGKSPGLATITFQVSQVSYDEVNRFVSWMKSVVEPATILHFKISPESIQEITAFFNSLGSTVGAGAATATNAMSTSIANVASTAGMATTAVGNLNGALGGLRGATSGAAGDLEMTAEEALANETRLNQLQVALNGLTQDYYRNKAAIEQNSIAMQQYNAIVGMYSGLSYISPQELAFARSQINALTSGMKVFITEERFAAAAAGDIGANLGLSEKQIASMNAQIKTLSASLNTAFGKYQDLISSNAGLSMRYTNLMASLSNPTADMYQPGRIAMVRSEVSSLLAITKAMDAETRSFGSYVGGALRNRFKYLLGAGAFMALFAAFRKIISSVKEIDKAMTNLRIITQQSESAYKSFSNTVTQSAREIGRSISELISSAETWARLGYSLNESAGLARATGIFANVADVSESEATTSITSVLKAYNYNADDAMHIVDILTQVGQKYAISASELGTALEKGGAALATAGNTLEESVALMAAGNAAVQNAETVGTALKTTTLRVAGSKAELEEMGEDVDDLASSTSKMRKEILALSGVDIMKDASTYKSTYQILKEIAAVWDKIDNVSQMALLEGLAGKRNASVIASVINNIKDLEGAYDDASNAAGTAERAQATYMDSVAGKQARLTAQFQEFSTEILDSGLIKGVYDLGYGFVWLLTQIAKTNMLLPTLIGLFATLRATRKQMALEESATGIANYMITGLGGQLDINNANSVRAYAEALAELKPRMRERVMDQLQLNEEQRQAVLYEMANAQATDTLALKYGETSVAALRLKLAESGIKKEILDQALAEAGLTTATRVLTAEERRNVEIKLLQKAATLDVTSEEYKQVMATYELVHAEGTATGVTGLFKAALNGLKTTLKSLWATIVANPWIAVVAALTAAAAALLIFRKTQADYIEDAKEALKEAEEYQSKLEENVSTYDELIKRRKELLQLGEQATLAEVQELDTIDGRLKKLERENAILKENAKLKMAEADQDFRELNPLPTFDAPGLGAIGAVKPIGLTAEQEGNRYTRQRVKELANELSELNFEFDRASSSIEAEARGIHTGNMTSYTNRPYVSSEQMRAAGWLEFPDGDIATTYFNEIEAVADDESIYLQVTPILDNGKVLSPESLDEYINNIMSQADGDINKALSLDANGLRIIHSWWTDEVSDEDLEWYNDKLGEIKGTAAQTKRTIDAISAVDKDGIPNLFEALYGDIDPDDADELNDKLAEENTRLAEAEGIMNQIEAAGYKYDKDATDPDAIKRNYNIMMTNLSRDVWMVLSGIEGAYESTLGHLVEYGQLDLEEITGFVKNAADAAWLETEDGAAAVQYLQEVLYRFGIEIKSDSHLLQILQAFLEKTKRDTDGAGDAFDGVIKSLEDIKKLKDPIEALTKAEKEMSDSGYLSYDTYQKLIALNLDDYIVEVADGYQLATGAMEGYLSLSRDSIVADLEAAQARLAAAEANLADARAMNARSKAYSGFYLLTGNDRMDGGKPRSAGYMGSAEIDAAADEVARLQKLLDNYDRWVKMFQRDTNGSGSKSNEDPFLAQWERVNEAMKHEVEMGKRTQESYIEWLRATTTRGHKDAYLNANEETYKKYADKIKSVQEEIRKYDLGQLDKQKDVFESLVDYRIKMLEEETKKQKEELDKRKDALKDFYDKQIEMLEEQFDEEDYLEEQAEKRKELADMQRQMDMLERDDSAWAKKRLAELKDEYHDAEEDYRKWERDHARDAVKKTLEDERDAAVKAIEDEQDALEKRTEDAAALRRQAIEDILSGNADVMRAMEQFSIEQGEWLDQDITDKWELATKAVQKYGGALAALKALIGVDAENNETYRFFADIFSGEYKKHASGTSNASAGWAITQENGFEAIMRKSGGMFTLLGAGDKVFNASATDFLYAFANNPMDILASSMSRMLSRSSLSPAFAGSSGSSTTNIDMGDVIINGDTNDKTVSEIRREKRALMNELLHEFKKLRGF